MVCLPIVINNDIIVEDDEMFTVRATVTSTGVLVGETEVTIEEDDSKVYLKA